MTSSSAVRHFNSKGPIQRRYASRGTWPADDFNSKGPIQSTLFKSEKVTAIGFQFQRSNSERSAGLRGALPHRDFNSKGPIQRGGLPLARAELTAFQFQRSNSEEARIWSSFSRNRISIPKVQFRVATSCCSPPPAPNFNSKGPIQSGNRQSLGRNPMGFQFQRSNSERRPGAPGPPPSAISIPKVQFRGKPHVSR